MSTPLVSTTGQEAVPATSSFRGRQSELAEADSLLDGCRFLTVTGPGGQGKTRFAVELLERVASTRASNYVDGIYGSYFASLREPSLVLPTLCQTLGVREEAGLTPLDALSAHLAGKRQLVLLDNMEHLLASTAGLGELAERVPGLTFLATSREALGLPGEIELELPPLGEAESVELFCDRAHAEPSDVVRDLCVRLEGLPLAIELAAARMRLLSPEQLLDRLSRRLDLLRARDAVEPRHTTLRATIEWSYDLLDDEERRALRGLSVFVGGCTAEAARAVVHTTRRELDSLVSKSLVRRVTDEAGSGRYVMLETIREFAAEALAAASEEPVVRARRRAYFVALAVELEPELYGASSTQDSRRFAADRTNLDDVLAEATTAGDAATALRLVRSLGDYWHMTSGKRPSYEAARAALVLSGGDSEDHARALHRTGRLAFELGDHEAYDLLFSEAERELVVVGDDRGLWQLLQERCFYGGVLGAYADAEVDGRRAVALARALADEGREAIAAAGLALLRMERADAVNDPDPRLRTESVRAYSVALDWARREGFPSLEQVFAFNLAWMKFLMDEPVEALADVHHGLRILLRGGTEESVVKGVVLSSGLIASRLGAHRETALLVSFALAEYAREGQQPHEIEEGHLPDAQARAVAALGREEYERAYEEGRHLSREDAIAIVLALEPSKAAARQGAGIRVGPR